MPIKDVYNEKTHKFVSNKEIEQISCYVTLSDYQKGLENLNSDMKIIDRINEKYNKVLEFKETEKFINFKKQLDSINKCISDQPNKIHNKRQKVDNDLFELKSQYYKTYEPLITYLKNIRNLNRKKETFNDLPHVCAVDKIKEVDVQIKNELIIFQNKCEHKYETNIRTDIYHSRCWRNCEVCEKKESFFSNNVKQNMNY
jgi:hypothetical protein